MITKTRAVLAALAVTAALAGCAPQATAADQAAAPATDTARATYDQIIDNVYGTPEQRRAAAEAGWLRTQLAIASCMAKTGQQYKPAPFQPLPDTGVAPGDILAFAPAREDFGVGRRVQALAAAGDTIQPALAGATTDQAAKYTQAVSGCATGDITDAGNPKGQEVLDGQLVATLTEVERAATPTLADDYPTCLAKHGLTAINLSQLYVKVEQAYPPISYDQKSDATKAEGWAEAMAGELKAAAADASCRADAVEVALTAAKPVLTRFAVDHSSDLAAVAAGWAQATIDVVALRAKIA